MFHLVAQDLTIGHTAYSHLRNSNPTQYIQKDATAAMLTRIANANTAVLSELHISQSHSTLRAPLLPNMSLHTLATMGAQDPDIAWPVFKALWYELTATAQTAKTGGTELFKPRPPMLITVNGLAHWMTNSKYRSVEFEPIYTHNLALVRHYVSLLSSTSAYPALPHGGLILFSTSASNAPTLYSFDL